MEPEGAATEASPVKRLTHDAFISYSRKDRAFAVALEKALERQPLPRDVSGGRRRLDIFRDEEDLTGTDLYPSIERHLTDSSSLIVLCTPDARQSHYVNEEIRIFARTRGADAIIPILVSGIPNNEARPDQAGEMAFPEALFEVMEVPLAADFSGFNPGEHKIHRGLYRDPWFMLLANLLGMSREQVEERERKRRLRRFQAFGAAAAAIIVALSAALVVTVQARNDARDQQRLATEQALVSQATALGVQAQQASDQTVRLLLGAHALRMTERAESIVGGTIGRHRRASHQSPFYRALTEVGERISRVSYQGPTYWMTTGAHAEGVVHFSDDGRWLVTGTYLATGSWESEGGCCFVLWYLGDGAEGVRAEPLPADPDVAGAYQYADLDQVTADGVAIPRAVDPFIAFSTDGAWLATGHNDHSTQLRRLDSRLPSEVLLRYQHERELRSFDLSPDGRWLAVSDSVLHVWSVDQLSTGPAQRSAPGAGVDAVEFDPTGEWLASATGTGDISLWRLPSGSGSGPTQAIALPNGPAHAIQLPGSTSLTWSPSGRWLGVTFGDSIAVVDIQSPTGPAARFEHRLASESSWVVSGNPPVFSPSGDFLLTTLGGDRHRLHPLGDGPRLSSTDGEIWEGPVAFSPSGRWLVTGAALYDLEEDRVLGQPGPRLDDPDRGRVYLALNQAEAIWETELEGRQRVGVIGAPGDVPELLSPNGRWLLTVGGKIIDLADPIGPHRILPGTERWSFYSQTRFSPDDGWLLAQNGDMTHLHDLGSAPISQIMGRLLPGESTVATADQRWLLTYVEGADHALLWDAHHPENSARAVVGDGWDGRFWIEVAANEDWLLARRGSGPDSDGRLWRRSTADDVFHEVLRGEYWDMAFSPDGSWLLVEWVNPDQSQTDLYDVRGDELRLVGEFGTWSEAEERLASLQRTSPAVIAQPAEGGSGLSTSRQIRWAVEIADGEIRLRDQAKPDSGYRVLDSVPSATFYDSLFSQDRRWMAIGKSVWDLQGDGSFPAYRVSGPGLESRLFEISRFSPDGRWAFVRESEAGRVSICSLTDLRSAYLNCALLDGAAVGPGFYPALFSGDGHWLVTWGQANEPQLWNLRSTNPAAASITGIDEPFGFSPDGQWLLQFADDGRRLKRLPLNPALALTRACQAAGRNLSSAEWTRYMGDVEYECTCGEYPPGYGTDIKVCGGV